MADKNPYGLRNADIENLDLSEFAKDFSADELAAVRAGLLQKRQQQQEQFNSLPVFDQAKIYAGEKFGEVKKAVEDNPELLLGVLAGKAALDVGSSAVQKTKSLYDRMINKPSDSLGAPAPKTQMAAETFTPEKVPTTEQETQKIVEQGKIKTGKAGGSISPIDATIESNVITGQQVSNVTEKVGKPPPEGWRSQYAKGKKNPIGPGGFNYIAGQYGPEEAASRWEQQYGKKNVPYEKVVEDFSAAKRPELPVGEGKKPGGSFPKPEFIPEYIRGSAPVEGMARTGLAALGIMPVAQKIKEGDYKGALNELIPAMAMISPSLSLAASPLYTSDEEIAILKKAEQGRKVGAGRGIAPPSAYMR